MLHSDSAGACPPLYTGGSVVPAWCCFVKVPSQWVCCLCVSRSKHSRYVRVLHGLRVTCAHHSVLKLYDMAVVVHVVSVVPCLLSLPKKK